jgi:hypothetical protein
VAVSLVPFSSLAAVARKSVGASLAQMAMVASDDDTTGPGVPENLPLTRMFTR